MIGTDIEFMNFVSSRITRFEWIQSGMMPVGIGRCPFCGDSKRSESKRRFYVFSDTRSAGRSDNLILHCHNCGYHKFFPQFLEEMDQALYKEYRMRIFVDKGGVVEKKKVKAAIPPRPFGISSAEGAERAARAVKLAPPLCVPLSDLEEAHVARQYIRSRRLPEIEFYWSEDFTATSEAFGRKDVRFKPEGRIVFCLRGEDGETMAIQGRSLNPKSTAKYITIKKDAQSRKVWGLDRANFGEQVIVVEGALDAMCLPNAVATTDNNLLSVRGRDMLYCPDNQYRNADIAARVEQIIAAGEPVVIWPASFHYKDINAAVIDGVDIMQVIKDNTFSGLRAKLRWADINKSVRHFVAKSPHATK